jgi:bacillithiol biosynthesis cysteine-adding enzyme BshC
MDSRALAFRQLPHQPKLFLDYLDAFDRVKPFYAHPPAFAAVKKVARKVPYPQERRAEVAAILREQNRALGVGSAALENLRRFENGAVAVVSGQQVGLFGGPAYAIYKALTAVQIAAELTEQGIEAVPIFWMATEDHDLDEVRHATLFSDGRLQRFELPMVDGDRPVGGIKLGPAVTEPARELADFLANQGSALLAQAIRETYRADQTYGEAFGKLFAKLFSEQGLIFLDPLDENLHRIAAPVYRKAVEEREALNEMLLQRGKDLDKAGYAAQVKVTAKSTLLFHMGAGPREVISASGAKFQAGAQSWTREELAGAVDAHPEHFSPNALFRPVVQDYLLPTAAYVGGPAEICYFAQSEVIYSKVLGRMPVMLPRAGFTIVDARAAKLLKRYDFRVEDIWSGPQAVKSRLECKSVPASVAKTFEKSQKEFKRMLAQLEKQIAKVDPTLKGSVETAKKKIDYQLEKLRKKVGRAQDMRNGILAEQEEYLESLLYPHKGMQSRELCPLPFLARLGAGGLSELQNLSGSKKLGHHFVVQLP